MAGLSIAPALATPRSWPRSARSSHPRRRLRISCIGWDHEGILVPPQGGHITRMEFKRRLEKDSDAREAFDREIREEQERRRARREARLVPETNEGLVEYFLDTEARELESEMARLRPRLNKEFFDHLQLELGQLRFSVSHTKEMEDRIIELEEMQKVLLEGTEAYDKMETDLVLAKQRLKKILQSVDKKTTLLEMAKRNELTRSVLTLFDENITSAIDTDQKEAAAFMESVRATMLKYITVPPLTGTQFLQKPHLRKKRSLTRQRSQARRGKPDFDLQGGLLSSPSAAAADRDRSTLLPLSGRKLQTPKNRKKEAMAFLKSYVAGAEQEARHRADEGEIEANQTTEAAIQQRNRAQVLMENAELAAYKSAMALRIAEAKRVLESSHIASVILD